MPGRKIDRLIDHILKLEGGYVDHPNDRGGPTNYGITLKTLKEVRGSHVTAEDVKALTEDDARRIYLDRYYHRPGFEELGNKPTLEAVLLDSAVQHGPKQAVKFLQRALGVTEDGVLGPETLDAADRFSPGDSVLAARVLGRRLAFYARVLEDESQRPFASGWMNRLSRVLDQAYRDG